MANVVVLGGGPAGVTAALRARELGANVTLVERGRMGGTCTNDGCVPTRVLARAARFVRNARQFEDYGVSMTGVPSVVFGDVIKRTQQVVYQIHEKKQLLDHLRQVNVTTHSEVGGARFISPNAVQCESGTVVEGERFIICVGGSARRLPFPGAEYALTHSDVWMLDKLPRSASIIGSGATGCQLASILNAFGCDVTLLDIAPRILITEDALVAETVAGEFRERGIQIITGIEAVERIERENGAQHLVYKHQGGSHWIDAEAVILSVGWPGNVDSLNLDAAGVAAERSYIKVNDHLQTTAPHIFAAGDVTGRIMLVQTANYQARVAAENAVLGAQRLAEERLVPHGGFTDPEYGGVGLTEEQAKQKHNIAVAVVPYSDLDRAVIDGQTTGFCKLVVDRQTQQVVGAHVVGEQALEVVQMVATGMAGKLRIDQYADLELAYPTFASIVGLAARQLARELGTEQVAPEWWALKQVRGAEWERSGGHKN
jgi:pyruvate/2-oxoglutarate dehydrogenase complex dihydrolipoamide dehydrogenase (E3) component